MDVINSMRDIESLHLLTTQPRFVRCLSTTKNIIHSVDFNINIDEN